MNSHKNPAKDHTGKPILIYILHHAPGNVEYVTVAADTETVLLGDGDGAIVALIGVQEAQIVKDASVIYMAVVESLFRFWPGI